VLDDNGATVDLAPAGVSAWLHDFFDKTTTE
jgi:hypothetical protein